LTGASTFKINKEKEEKDAAAKKIVEQQQDAQEKYEDIVQNLRNMNPDENRMVGNFDFLLGEIDMTSHSPVLILICV